MAKQAEAPEEQDLTVLLGVRVSEEMRERIEAARKKQHFNGTSEWVRVVLMREVARVLDGEAA